MTVRVVTSGEPVDSSQQIRLLHLQADEQQPLDGTIWCKEDFKVEPKLVSNCQHGRDETLRILEHV
jgi:hypothetical protein